MPAITIAKWILLIFNKNKERVDEPKLECLLYIAQGLSFRMFNKPLFKDEIIKWAFGPYVWEVFHKFRNYSWSNIPVNWTETDLLLISKEDSQVIKTLYYLYKNLSSWELLEMIENEDPYIQTIEDEIITKEKIRVFFQTPFLDNYYFKNKHLKYSEENLIKFEKFKESLEEAGII